MWGACNTWDCNPQSSCVVLLLSLALLHLLLLQVSHLLLQAGIILLCEQPVQQCIVYNDQLKTLNKSSAAPSAAKFQGNYMSVQTQLHTYARQHQGIINPYKLPHTHGRQPQWATRENQAQPNTGD